MECLKGRSAATAAADAVDEVIAAWPHDAKPDLILAFCPVTLDGAGIAKELSERYPSAIVTGTSAVSGQLDGAFSADSVVVTAITTPRVRWTAARIDEVSKTSADDIAGVVDDLFASLAIDRETFVPDRHFCLLFADSLGSEELLCERLADSLDGVGLAGGSASDDWTFADSSVFFAGEAHADAAVVVLAESEAPFQLFKHQHFTTSDVALAVTRVDPENPRRVLEIDGYPAMEAYARAIGEPVDETSAALNPLTFTVMGSIYVRSPLQFEADTGAIVFVCAIEEGTVVRLGTHHPMEAALSDQLAAVTETVGDDGFLLTFNCIYRATEAAETEQVGSLGCLLAESSATSIGFDTYGEQFNGVHVNQTLVGLALAN